MRPRLIHPVDVTIERYKRGESVQDPDAREPIKGGEVYEASYTIPAQVEWKRTESFVSLERTGARLESDGHLTFLIEDLDAAGFRPQYGDKVTRIASEVVELYIIGGELSGHYPDMGGPTLFVTPFSTDKV